MSAGHDHSHTFDGMNDDYKRRLMLVTAINIGMFLMMVASLLPIGLLQTAESISNGYWSARSAEFMQTETMQFWRWMRVLGDSIFGIGAVAFVWFSLQLIARRPKAEIVAVGELAEA